MAIVYDGKVVRLQVKPGKEGMDEFQKHVRRAFNLGEDVELDCVFDCRAPGSGEKIKLRGMESFSAAMHCAAVAAGERLAKQSAAGNPTSTTSTAASTSSSGAPAAAGSVGSCGGIGTGGAPRIRASLGGAAGSPSSSTSSSPSNSGTCNRSITSSRALRAVGGPPAGSPPSASALGLSLSTRCSASCSQILPAARTASARGTRPNTSGNVSSASGVPTSVCRPRNLAASVSGAAPVTTASGEAALSSLPRIPSPPQSSQHAHVCQTDSRSISASGYKRHPDLPLAAQPQAYHQQQQPQQPQQQLALASRPQTASATCALPPLATIRREEGGGQRCSTGGGCGDAAAATAAAAADAADGCGDVNGMEAMASRGRNLLAGFFRSLAAARRVM